MRDLRLIVFAWVVLSSFAKADPKSSERYKSIETLAKGLFYLEDLYVEPDKVKYEEMVHQALKGVVSKLDPHTVVMPKKLLIN